MKNYILGIGTILIIGLLILLAYLSTKPNSKIEISLNSPQINQPTTIPTSNTILTPTYSIEADNLLIKKALFADNNWPDDGSMTFTVSTNDGKYASGGVSSQGGGGYFFAEKVNGKWEIVADGNGTISCSDMEKYPDFPKTLIPECYNETTQKSVKR
jgi:hypothetical protein